MPFTPAHAVVALPFVRTPLLPSAIAVGAMTPDIPLFLRGTPLSYQLTHSNVLATALIGAVLLMVWYLLIRPAVRELAPEWLARRLPPEWDSTGRSALSSMQRGAGPRAATGRGARTQGGRALLSVLIVGFSLVLGVASHIAWDAFTHEGRWGVNLVPALSQAWGPLLGYKWLQYGSGVVGLAVLAVFAVRWISARQPAPLNRRLPTGVRWAWWLSLPAALAIGWFGGLAVLGPLSTTFTAQHLAYRVLPPACAVWGVISLALCVAILIGRRRSSTPAAQSA